MKWGNWGLDVIYGVIMEHRKEQIRKYGRRNIGNTVETKVGWMTDILLRSG